MKKAKLSDKYFFNPVIVPIIIIFILLAILWTYCFWSGIVDISAFREAFFHFLGIN